MGRLPLCALTVPLLASLAVAGCSQPTTPTDDPARTVDTTPAAAYADVFPFRIGALEAAALKDGDIDAPNDGSIFAVDQPIDQVSTLLADSGLPTDTLHMSIQPLLVRSGERVLLFDTGAGAAPFARGGCLPASLRQAGTEPAQVTDVFISHGHLDHVGGLLTAEGAPAFPNAVIHIAAAEWAWLLDSPENEALTAAIAPGVSTFEPGASLIAGQVTAVAVDGHTPGHTAYEISSEDETLLYLGDTVHHHVISVRQPEWTVVFDADAPVAQASRRALLQRATDTRQRIYSVHFPFPGLGSVQAEGDGFEWYPEG